MKKIISFDGNIVKCYTEDEVKIIAIGDGEIEPDNYIIISRLKEEKGKNTRDSIYLDSSTADIGYYGAIERISIFNDAIEIVISDNKQAKMNASEFKVNIEQKPINLQLLLQYVKDIFSEDMIDIKLTNI